MFFCPFATFNVWTWINIFTCLQTRADMQIPNTHTHSATVPLLCTTLVVITCPIRVMDLFSKSLCRRLWCCVVTKVTFILHVWMKTIISVIFEMAFVWNLDHVCHSFYCQLCQNPQKIPVFSPSYMSSPHIWTPLSFNQIEQLQYINLDVLFYFWATSDKNSLMCDLFITRNREHFH